VLFVSALRPMYGPGSNENHTIAKLLWSLRNTPAFTNLAPWWLVYVPRGLLARSMYAEGAREMTLADFVAHFAGSDDPRVERFWGAPDRESDGAAFVTGQLFAGRHYALVAMLTNHGSETPELAGTPLFRGPPQDPAPGTLASVASALSWEEQLIHPAIAADLVLSALPPFFTVASTRGLENGRPHNESTKG
jgi:hypothetical protein